MYSTVFSQPAIHDLVARLESESNHGRTIPDLMRNPYRLFGELDPDQMIALATLARAITRQRFGPVMRLFVPLYLSNECYNHCTYCGFSYNRTIDRYTLTHDDIKANVTALVNKGFQHILLLTGEANKSVDMTYFRDAIPIIRPHIAHLGMEVQPLDQEDYTELIQLGLDAVTVYQETYHKDRYLMHHLSGKKRRFDYRLDTPDRACQAGIFRMTIGALLGLSDWRFDAIALMNHVTYLCKRYWKTQFSVSFPRITSVFDPHADIQHVPDAALTQLVCAFRCLFPDLGIVLSTRESAALRNELMTLGITDMSAESLTSPGAYAGIASTEQFATSDKRPLQDVCHALEQQGIAPVLKDWDRQYTYYSRNHSGLARE